MDRISGAKGGLLRLIVLNACLRLLQLARALPAAVRGPLLFCAFLRLTSICFSELIAAPLAPRPSKQARLQLPPLRQRKRAKMQLPRRPPAGPAAPPRQRRPPERAAVQLASHRRPCRRSPRRQGTARQHRALR